jgi:transcriptional regulator with XRE-family HTH domain
LPESGSPTISRRELGALLRALRTDRGWTVEQVAARLMVSASKVSRLETGQRGVSPRDIRDLCDLYEVDDDTRARLTDLAAEGKQHSWWQPLSLPFTPYVELESAAASIHDYALMIMPGLLQTPDYARAVIAATPQHWSRKEIELRVEGRLLRQQILLRPDPPAYEVILGEATMSQVVGGPAVMAAQLRRLIEASWMPTVNIRLIRFDAGPLPAGNSKFIVLRFAQPGVPAQVYIEELTKEQFLVKPEDVDIYAQTFDLLRHLALPPDQTRAALESVASRYEAASSAGIRGHRPE